MLTFECIVQFMLQTEVFHECFISQKSKPLRCLVWYRAWLDFVVCTLHTFLSSSRTSQTNPHRSVWTRLENSSVRGRALRLLLSMLINLFGDSYSELGNWKCGSRAPRKSAQSSARKYCRIARASDCSKLSDFKLGRNCYWLPRLKV